MADKRHVDAILKLLTQAVISETRAEKYDNETPKHAYYGGQANALRVAAEAVGATDEEIATTIRVARGMAWSPAADRAEWEKRSHGSAGFRVGMCDLDTLRGLLGLPAEPPIVLPVEP